MMICANHISDIDPVFLLMAQKRHIYYMAKAELFGSGIARWFFGKKFGAFPVKRGTGDTSAIDTSERIVKEGKLLGIFPEGTRSKDGKLGRAKSGAALIASRTGSWIIPAAIQAKDQKVRLSTGRPSASAYRCRRRSFIWRILSIRICAMLPG